MRNLNCFIASAFGYDDVDLIFDNVIKPVLKELKIKAIRIDRINHNDKIDDKIIELIKECDFGIVDLTYARPSAYFEAGFIEGMGKKVIYISRKDHFKQKDSDTKGNEKIHFDLITKNIIGWAQPNEMLKKQLKSRVGLVIKPLIFQLQKTSEESIFKRQFESLSLSNRLKMIQESVVEFLEKTDFKPMSDEKYHTIYKKGKHVLKFEVLDSITKDDLSYFNIKNSKYIYGPNKFIIILCSLKAMPKSRIEKALRLFDPISSKIYKLANTTIYFLDSIDSLIKLKEQLGQLNI